MSCPAIVATEKGIVIGFQVEQLPRYWTEMDMSQRYRAAGNDSGNCLHATRVALSVCQHYEVEATAMFGIVLALNRKGYRAFKNQVPNDQWSPSAWSVGVSLEEPGPTTIGGHAFVSASQDGQDYVIDMSAGQMDRPDRGIHLGPLALPLDDAIEVINWTGVGETYVWRLGQTYVAYSGGTEEWTPPWEWSTVPTGFTLVRNQREITDMVRHIDGELQSG